jgi:hypothetical protein
MILVTGSINKPSELIRASEVIHMSIEWLLTKTQKTQIHERAAESACRAADLPEEPCSMPPEGSNEEMNGPQEQDRRVPEHPTDYSVDNRQSTPHLRCGCGCNNPVPLPVSGKKSGIVRFECAGCGGTLHYNPQTRIVRTRKGILGFLFGRLR